MWREAHALLRERVAGAPELVRAATAVDIPALPFAPQAVRTFVTTGVGSSAAPAALLAHLLSVELGVPARCAPLGAFVAPAPDTAGDMLVVFSQGLSPNARLALAAPQAWRAVVVVTAVTPETGDADATKLAALAAVRDAGGVCVTQPGGLEYGTLLRLGGPLTGYAIAYRLAAAIGRAAGLPVGHLSLDADAVCAAMCAAAAAAAPICAAGDPLGAPVILLASGGYGALAGNLALKLQEGLLEAPPAVVDLIEFAHGPFQAISGRTATLLMLQRTGAPLEDALLSRLHSMLDDGRHRLVLLPAELRGMRALFEHEALLNELILDAIAARRVDQARWPGRGRDRPLYDVAEPAIVPARTAAKERSAAAGPPAHERALASLTWPDVEALLRGGARTAVLPLGATEQHGPHLPFATDTHIAEALADRFCARVPEAIRLPALPLGCSSEHAAFPGTLSLRSQTLCAAVQDVVTSLAAHGFDTVVIFSAHGGNDAVLREALPALRAAAAPTQVIGITGIDRLTAVWHAASGAAGVDARAAGHHAGEFETSILLALAPETVRRERLAPGLLEVGGNPQAIFYPSLRAHSPSGVVGDPRAAAAERAERYLAAWADALVAAYEREKNRAKTSGTQNA
jgi:creatinine amidohydrolase